MSEANIVETIARAMSSRTISVNGWHDFAEDARAAITALEASGYAIVPIEPTEAMIEAGQETECEHGEMNCGAANAYRAMTHAGKAKG